MGRREIANYLIFQLRLSVSGCVLVSMFSRVRTICNRCERSVVNEASCSGCPVIATGRVGAAQELTALLNPPFISSHGDVDALAELLEVSLANPVLLAERGRAARQRMETCRSEKISPGP